MGGHAAMDLSALYLEDETAWLDAMAELIAEGRRDELDYEHLREYLHDMDGAIAGRSGAG